MCVNLGGSPRKRAFLRPCLLQALAVRLCMFGTLGWLAKLRFSMRGRRLNRHISFSADLVHPLLSTARIAPRLTALLLPGELLSLPMQLIRNPQFLRQSERQHRCGSLLRLCRSPSLASFAAVPRPLASAAGPAATTAIAATPHPVDVASVQRRP
eukprot:6195813-Pleurochrysis_carterae.AAC.3